MGRTLRWGTARAKPEKTECKPNLRIRQVKKEGDPQHCQKSGKVNLPLFKKGKFLK